MTPARLILNRIRYITSARENRAGVDTVVES